MTKKDFEAAAQTLRMKRMVNLNSINDTPLALENVCQEIEDFLVLFFREDNHRFDTDRFRKACRP